MFKKLSILCCVAIMLFSTSCASIFGKNQYPVTINSVPSNSYFSVYNKKGQEIFNGKTPKTIELKSSEGYFSKARYEIKFENEGYETKIVPIKASLNGWYVGNVFFGGLIGLLIVDPLTGSMYKLKTESVSETLIKNENTELSIYSIDDIPTEWKNQLVLIK